tara:strand:+ start:264 stop:554 length:291 start_codon:yes stop_codon:yes gene_type:complete
MERSTHNKAFKFGTWPNGKDRWVIGRWDKEDNTVEYIYPSNFESERDAKRWMELMNITDEDGEEALRSHRASMPSEAQTRYNQRDIEKRNEKLRIN